MKSALEARFPLPLSPTLSDVVEISHNAMKRQLDEMSRRSGDATSEERSGQPKSRNLTDETTRTQMGNLTVGTKRVVNDNNKFTTCNANQDRRSEHDWPTNSLLYLPIGLVQQCHQQFSPLYDLLYGSCPTEQIIEVVQTVASQLIPSVVCSTTIPKSHSENDESRQPSLLSRLDTMEWSRVMSSNFARQFAPVRRSVKRRTNPNGHINIIHYTFVNIQFCIFKYNCCAHCISCITCIVFVLWHIIIYPYACLHFLLFLSCFVLPFSCRELVRRSFSTIVLARLLKRLTDLVDSSNTSDGCCHLLVSQILHIWKTLIDSSATFDATISSVPNSSFKSLIPETLTIENLILQ